ncbi:hypothetical protein FDP41_000417 [Naegleria fowleri]|uniref:Uncharacterized protein n=1 Tax=Naegleria fowleri TaxID=5763 RepID=A0A6A5CGS3_NAEFO|nr:uncharacterized protein FDP41_000417 [Naegleria fowleri]KAF0984518.1 hypothetical protein FDP41_000417 [Naegleria fowleri]
MYSDDDRCTILDNFQHGSNQGVSQSADNKITKELMQTIELYNSVNGSFTHTSPMADGKVILVGDSMVGKTSLFVRIIRNVFSNNYRPTIGMDFNIKKYKILDIPFSVVLWDTAGQERFKSLSTSYHRGASACILTFDLNSPETLHSIKNWYNQVKAYAEEPNIKWYLIGTKCDLVKHVDDREVQQIADELKAEYWEVSSKDGINVEKLFNRVAFIAWKDKLEKWKEVNSVQDKKDQENQPQVHVNLDKSNSSTQPGSNGGGSTNNGGSSSQPSCPC